MPNLVKEFRVEVDFLLGEHKAPPPPAELELKITPQKIGLSVTSN